MTDNLGTNEVFRRSIYRKTLLDIHSLEQKMPEEILVLLAREVLHRLSQQGESKREPDAVVQDQEIESLCQALLSDTPNAGAQFVSELRLRGVPLNTIYLSYLGGAARKLGIWWEEDAISFVAVTAGTSRIYGIMRGLNPFFIPTFENANKQAIFASCPGETHTLGVKMASDLFRKSGWHIELKMGRDHDTLVHEISQSRCVLVGLSAAGEHALPEMAKLIVAIRVVKPEALIMVSGNIAKVSTEIVSLMAPDGMAVQFEEAMSEMERLWGRLTGLAKTSQA